MNRIMLSIKKLRSHQAIVVAIALATAVLTGCNGDSAGLIDDGGGGGGGGDGGGDVGSTRVYQGFDTSFPQTMNDSGNVGAELTIDDSMGTVALVSGGGALVSSITPGYESFGYQPLTTGGWYLFEAPGALAILVQHPTGGLQQAQIDRIYVGLLKSTLTCPSDGKEYGLSYGLRLDNGGAFPDHNGGVNFTYHVDPTPSVFSTYTLAGTFPNYTDKDSVSPEIQMLSDNECTGSGVYYGRNAAIFNARLSNTSMVGAIDNNASGFKTAAFVGNSTTLSSITGYAGTYDGIVVNDPNGSTWKTGVTIDSSGNLGGTTLVTGTSPTLQLLGASANQMVLTAGSGGTAEEWIVTPVQSGTKIALWGTRYTSDVNSGTDQFFFLFKRP